MALSIAQYRQKAVAEHGPEARRKYQADLKRLHGDKMKKGTKVLVNLRGKNVPAVITKDLTPQNTSVEIKIGDKIMRKDLATIYGVEGDKGGIEEASPGAKLQKVVAKGRPGTPRKLLLEKQAGKGKKKVSEGVPPKRAKTPPRKNGKKPVKSAGTPRPKKKQATTIEGEISNLMKASDRLEKQKSGGKNYK